MMNSQISPQEAAKELLNRRAIRRSLTEYSRYKGFEPAPHHKLIIDELEAFIGNPDLDVLLLHAPPGSAKSTYVSVLFPAWYLANYSKKNILFATHSGEFAQRWGRRVRNDIANDGLVLGVTMSQDNAAADRWALQEGGEYYGVGAGVGISGFRADLGVCDDLFGNREDAWSETVRQKRWDWFRDDFSARLKPGGKRILMNTRWHEEDVAGHVLEQINLGVMRGRVITISAIAESDDPLGRKEGEYLWDDPKGYNYGAYLRERQKETSPMMWSALYQQRPTPEEGEFFKREWFRLYDEKPKALRLYGASDYAVTADGGDYTVHLVAGVDPEDNIYIVDLWRGQTDSDVWIERFLDLVSVYKPLTWAEESGQILKSLGPFIDKRMRERRTYAHREQFTSVSDKGTRCQAIRARAASGKVYLPSNKPWTEGLMRELLTFPAGKHDDQVDAFGLIGRMLDTMVGGRLPPKPSAEKRTGYSERDDDGDIGLSIKAA